jgi:hypothetical protein
MEPESQRAQWQTLQQSRAFKASDQCRSQQHDAEHDFLKEWTRLGGRRDSYSNDVHGAGHQSEDEKQRDVQE